MKTDALFLAEALELRYEPPRAALGPARCAACSVDRLEIRPGECVALVGPNGSGKTTLLKALNGLLRPSAGRLLFEGEDAAFSRRLRMRSVYLHQAPYLLAGSVSYNVHYGARARGCRAEEAVRRGAEALALVGLTGWERRGHRALSGGEAQRVALARAFASGADVLLLDEPTASADADSVILVIEALLARLRQGATVIFSTHDLSLAERLSARVLLLESGRLKAVESRGAQGSESCRTN
jgi:ABC-type multidrug transport system ATPase subunit